MKVRMLNKLPYSIKINNKKYFINTNFRNMISFETEMQDIDDKDKETFVLITLKKWCPAFFKENHSKDELIELSSKFVDFYKCNKENYHKTSGGGTPISQVFNYKYDDDYLYGAFLGQYGIDLCEIDQLHWWKYKALLNSLKSDNKLEYIKECRAYTGKDKDKLLLKEYWSLPLDKNLQKELDTTAEELMKYKK